MAVVKWLFLAFPRSSFPLPYVKKELQIRRSFLICLIVVPFGRATHWLLTEDQLQVANDQMTISK